MELTRFLENILERGSVFVVKRLSGNDTTLTKSHQSGVYFPRWFFERAFPDICTRNTHNPRTTLLEVRFVESGHVARDVQVVYYNSKFHPELGLAKAYDEFRITYWGGQRGGCPYQDPDNTGALTVFAIEQGEDGPIGHVWVSRSEQEDNMIEGWVGFDVLPGESYGNMAFEKRMLPESTEVLARKIIPDSWYKEFPTGSDVFDTVSAAIPKRPGLSLDQLLLDRRALEFAVFKAIEEAHVLPQIRKGFENVDEFISFSLSVANRRKSRTGRSLELNLGRLFTDANLLFEEQVITENRKKPDFLFPSSTHYHDPNFDPTRLHMMAAKTCCKDRWRQILSEAERIKVKHLFTLQEGISEHQHKEMTDSNVKLVVPSSVIKKFPEVIRSEISNLQDFVSAVATAQHEAGLRAR